MTDQQKIWVAQQGVISHNWYVGYTLGLDGRVTIVFHGRRHMRRDPQVVYHWNGFHLVEDADRTVRKLTVHDKTYEVANPRHVFDYPDVPATAEAI